MCALGDGTFCETMGNLCIKTMITLKNGTFNPNQKEAHTALMVTWAGHPHLDTTKFCEFETSEVSKAASTWRSKPIFEFVELLWSSSDILVRQCLVSSHANHQLSNLLTVA